MARYDTLLHVMAHGSRDVYRVMVRHDTLWHVMARYGTLWHTVRATFMHVMVRYDTLWHVVARYGTLWFRSGHNVQETRVKRAAFLTKCQKLVFTPRNIG